ncbi:hypothetical protein ACP4OV_023751 [Aristida adscensionis]
MGQGWKPWAIGPGLDGEGWQDEEGVTSPDAVDFICDTKWEAHEHHDDQDWPYRQGVPYESKAPNGSKSRSDSKV